MKIFFTQLSADAKLILNAIVNLAGNSVIVAALPALLPHVVVLTIFLIFNLAQVIYSFANPSYAVHLIQTGQLKAPTPKNQTIVTTIDKSSYPGQGSMLTPYSSDSSSPQEPSV